MKYSKIIALIACLISLSLQARVYLQPYLMPAHIQIENVIIAWDIHHVLAEDEGKIKKLGAAIPDIFSIIGTKLTNDAAWKEIEHVAAQMDISGEARYEIFLKYGHTDLAQMVERAANTYKPRKGMEKIVNKLHARGIQQHIASDIGPRFFDNLKIKFKKEKCCIFDTIKPGKIVDYSQFGPNKGKTILTPDLTTFCKPNLEFFIQFNNIYNPMGKKHIILIDDKLENIQAALKAGWSAGIHFDITLGNPVQRLEKELASLHLL